jgi:hypothetical protein
MIRVKTKKPPKQFINLQVTDMGRGWRIVNVHEIAYINYQRGLIHLDGILLHISPKSIARLIKFIKENGLY